MSFVLYTTSPAGSFSDGGSPGITTATACTFAANGNISAVQFYANPSIASSTVTVEVWQVTSLNDGAPAGTLLASKTVAGATCVPSAFNQVALTSLVPVDTTHVYRFAVNCTGGLYVATSGFFSAAPLVNGPITGLRDHAGTYPTLGNGTYALNAPPGTYPSSGGGDAAFVGPVFDFSASEKILAANLTATASMAAPLSTSTTLAANLTATASLSATLTVPTGPADPIGTPVAEQLLACLTEQLNQLPNPPARIQLRVGQETGPLIGANVDECCAGLAWIRISDIYPSWDSFPGPDNTWLPCGPLAYAVVLEMGVAFCMPWSDSDDTFDNVDPPNADDWAQAFATQMQHQTLMRRAAACCFLPTQRRAVGAWSSLPVEGGCTGGKMSVTVSVMAPCSDC